MLNINLNIFSTTAPSQTSVVFKQERALYTTVTVYISVSIDFCCLGFTTSMEFSLISLSYGLDGSRFSRDLDKFSRDLDTFPYGLGDGRFSRDCDIFSREWDKFSRDLDIYEFGV